ncbi:ribosome small subunit-dependent GTPase A [Litoreibacter janthinus]|uniref:Small ribosomal subunit biogenesis GTPase RsgA n=1 Tax=Litoreibacter janthinus TaxID=670154 RepID=A0A1I6FQK2_9RHOB|nr:ribosome small subunit-dependent GTPase A [Litoreibacter janthinus]SFR32225.1 ribosome biogenesis GTPase [Litoreibacter janthinus]
MTRDYSKFLPTTSEHAPPASPLAPLVALGWQPFFAQQVSIEQLQETPPLRVTEVHRNGLQARGDGIDMHIPHGPEATVGDWLLLNRELPSASEVLERKSVIKRRAPGKTLGVQLIAANLDTAFIVSSCNDDFNVARLERFIALSFEADVTPVIILTKVDTSDNAEHYIEQAEAISPLVPVVALNAKSDEPHSKLADWCKPGQTVAFLGSSGVGKSTLTNSLAGDTSIATQDVREDDARGRHTTTRRQLYFLSTGCAVLDTPGMRELQLTDAASGLAEMFFDLDELGTRCKFNDCKHTVEPGCAILAAVERGEIDTARLARWQKLVLEDEHNSATIAERRSKDKAFGKAVRNAQSKKKK